TGYKCIREWQRKFERRFAAIQRGPDATAVREHDMFRHVQRQTGTCASARARPKRAIEDLTEFAGAFARSGASHTYMQLRSIGANAYQHRSATRCSFYASA